MNLSTLKNVCYSLPGIKNEVKRLSRLEKRMLLGIKGQDVSNVLKNLTTNDYTRTTRDQPGQFTSFLLSNVTFTVDIS